MAFGIMGTEPGIPYESVVMSCLYFHVCLAEFNKLVQPTIKYSPQSTQFEVIHIVRSSDIVDEHDYTVSRKSTCFLENNLPNISR